MTSNLTVFIVDDDPAVRDALGLLLGVRGYRTALFSCAEDFLQGWQRAWAGCVLIDIRMSGMDGLSLQRRLLELGCLLPVIIVTGHGDVTLARQAFKAQVQPFLLAPQVATRGRLAREREVMQLVVTGRHNRDIAPVLGISVRTVEVHKARVMDKLGVDNVADLVRISMLGAD